eukprot:5009297-Amphidinium_carterae.1
MSSATSLIITLVPCLYNVWGSCMHGPRRVHGQDEDVLAIWVPEGSVENESLRKLEPLTEVMSSVWSRKSSQVIPTPDPVYPPSPVEGMQDERHQHF